MARTSLASAAGIALFLALAAPAAAAIVVPPLKQPTWTELTPQQREILAPLSGEWDKLEFYRRKKWLGIAQRYPAMSAEEQVRLQRRMQAWTKLTPEERKRARESYKSLKKAPPEQREVIKQKWQEYKQLPDDEKERLKEAAKRKTTPKSGAGKAAPAAVAQPNPAPPAPAVPATVAPATQPAATLPAAPATQPATAP